MNGRYQGCGGSANCSGNCEGNCTSSTCGNSVCTGGCGAYCNAAPANTGRVPDYLSLDENIKSENK